MRNSNCRDFVFEVCHSNDFIIMHRRFGEREKKFILLVLLLLFSFVKHSTIELYDWMIFFIFSLNITVTYLYLIQWMNDSVKKWNNYYISQLCFIYDYYYTKRNFKTFFLNFKKTLKSKLNVLGYSKCEIYIIQSMNGFHFKHKVLLLSNA